jgi:hypothetical protein
VAGTPVSLVDGTFAPIELIAVGDDVLSYDVEQNAPVAGHVIDVYVHPNTPQLLRINGTLTTTPEHRFYVDGQWVPAGQLLIGDVLLSDVLAGNDEASREHVTVTSLELLPGGVTTYNLEIEQVHDYFAGGVLVHNIKPPQPF